MNIFDDYVSWKSENSSMIDKLVKTRSPIVERFTSVIMVVDYLYDLHVNNHKRLSEDEQLIFSTGFDYIVDQFLNISNILTSNFKDNYEEMNKFSKTISLLLYIYEFQGEVKATDEIKDKISKLNELEEKINTCLEKKENAPEEYYILLNDINYSLFEQNGIEVHTIDQIFYEIACEYNLYPEDDYSVFNEIFSREIELNRNNKVS